MEASALGPDAVPDLTTQEVADMLGLSYHAVLRAVHRGEVRAYKICGRIRFRKEDVLAWIDASLVELYEPPAPLRPDPTRPAPERGSSESLREIERRFFEDRRGQ